MEVSTLRWPTDKEREEMDEVCSIGEVPDVGLYIGNSVGYHGSEPVSYIYQY